MECPSCKNGADIRLFIQKEQNGIYSMKCPFCGIEFAILKNKKGINNTMTIKPQRRQK